jgi:RNA polymerase sigma factor (sigma-70 family)
MTTGTAGMILGHIRRTIEAESVKGLPDAELVRRYAAGRDGDAFAALVQRYGRLVWGVCRRILPGEQDAEDAFQATFLVLARRADGIRKTASLASWLYGVAHRVGVRAGQRSRKRQVREQRAPARFTPEAGGELAWRELQAILEEELGRLPEIYRVPFALCHLDGRTREEAAREIGCAEGTVSSRIARARQILQRRLRRRGVSLSAVLCGTALRDEAGATVPAALADATVRAAGDPARATLAARALASAVGSAGRLAPRRAAVVLALVLGLLSVGTGAWLTGAPPEGERGPEPPVVAAVRKDLYGDPIPAGALARLGTVRLRAPHSHVAVTADGKEIVTAGTDLVVRRFDAQTGELRSVRALPPGRGVGWLSPRGTYAVTVTGRFGEKGELEIWDLASLKCLRTLPIVPGFAVRAAFAADERRLVVADGSGEVYVWDWQTSKPRVIAPPAGKGDPPQAGNPLAFALAVSPDGKRAADNSGRTSRCWDLDGGKLLWKQEEREAPCAMQFSADGGKVGVLLHDTGLYVRAAATGERKGSPLLWQWSGQLYAFDFTPDGRYVIFEDLQGVVSIVDVQTNRIYRQLPAPVHRDRFGLDWMIRSTAFTPDGKGLIRRSDVLQRWDLATGKPIFPASGRWGHTDRVTKVLFSADGRFLGSLSEGDESVCLWDVGTGRALHTIPVTGAFLAFTPDGRQLLARPDWHVDNTPLQAWDASTGRVARGFKNPATEGTFGGRELRVTTDAKKVLMLTGSPAALDAKSTLYVWEMEGGKRLTRREVPWGADSLITPDGESVLTFGREEGVRLLAIDTAKPRTEFRLEHPRGDEEKPTDCVLALSPDGRLIAARFRYYVPHDDRDEHKDEGPIYLGDTATGRQVAALECDGPARFTFSVDGRLLAAASGDVVRLWETASGRKIGTIQMPARLGSYPIPGPAAEALAFAPDGRTLATGHADCTILLWDATLRGGNRGGPLTAAQANSLWADLAGADAARAHAAVWALADDPARSVQVLRERLRPVTPPSPDQIKTLLADLDSDRFDTREAAERTLRDLGEAAGTALRAALATKLPAESKRRLEGIVAALDPALPPTGEQLRQLRSVMVLERTGTTEARQFLERLAGGVESARLTRAAKDALRRMAKK